MQSNSSLPFPLIPLVLFNGGQLSEGGFELSRFLFLGSLLFSQGGDEGMDLSKVGEKILSSVRSARSLGLLPSSSDRPEVPERAAAAAALARVLAGLPPHQRYTLSSSSEQLSSIYGSKPPGQVVEELEEEFYEEEFDPVGHILEHIPSEESELAYLEDQATLRLSQLDRISERLSCHVMEHHEVMVKGMDLVRQLERDLKIANVICMNGRRYLTSSRNEVSRDLIVSNNSKRKQALLVAVQPCPPPLLLLHTHIEILAILIQLKNSKTKKGIQRMIQGLMMIMGRRLKPIWSDSFSPRRTISKRITHIVR